MNGDERRSCEDKALHLRSTAFICGFIIITICGCARERRATVIEPMSLERAMTLIDQRAQWTAHPPIDVPRHPAEKYLAGWTVVLDPGHGGDDGGAVDPRPTHKRGPGGVREADVNLRVALLLRRLLADAGVNVIMTREGDDSVDLHERARVANRARADLFISLHHNAVGNPQTNYTSVWYHGPVDAAEPELDVARYVAHALGRELRTDVGRTSPVLDDKLMYGGGFSVLRACSVPAILLESSFYTNPAEEERLRDAGYNLREAYAVYVGLCEYAYGGRPTQSLPAVRVDGSRAVLTTTLDPGLPPWWGADHSRIIASSVQVTLDGRPLPATFDPQTRKLEAMVGEVGGVLPEVELVVSIHHANLFKHHNYPQRYRVRSVKRGEWMVWELEPLGVARARGGPGRRGPATATQPAATTAPAAP